MVFVGHSMIPNWRKTSAKAPKMINTNKQERQYTNETHADMLAYSLCHVLRFQITHVHKTRAFRVSCALEFSPNNCRFLALSSSRRVEMQSKTSSEVNAWTLKAHKAKWEEQKPQESRSTTICHSWFCLNRQITKLHILDSSPVERPQGCHWLM